MDNDKVIEKRVARTILNLIERVYFSKEFFEYRCNYGSNGVRDLILNTIKETYDVN